MDRPRVIVHQTASVDGRVAITRERILLYGDKRWQAVAGSGDGVYERLKATHRPQVILEGSGSFVLDGAVPEPLPLVEGDPVPLYEDFLPEAVVNRPGGRGWFTAVDGRGRVRWSYKEFPGEEWVGWYLLVLAAHSTPPEYLAYLRRENIPYLIAGAERVDLRLAFGKLAAQLGVTCVLSTAGGRLNGALLRAGLIDEISIDVFPAVIGGGAPLLFESPPLKPDEWPTRLRLCSAQAQPDGSVWLRYEVVPDAQGTE